MNYDEHPSLRGTEKPVSQIFKNIEEMQSRPTLLTIFRIFKGGASSSHGAFSLLTGPCTSHYGWNSGQVTAQVIKCLEV